MSVDDTLKYQEKFEKLLARQKQVDTEASLINDQIINEGPVRIDYLHDKWDQLTQESRQLDDQIREVSDQWYKCLVKQQEAYDEQMQRKDVFDFIITVILCVETIFVGFTWYYILMHM